MDRIKADVGSTVDFGVLLVGGNGEVSIGTPEVDKAKVVAEVLEHGRDRKILVFKYKNKTRYRRRHGHRQDYTRLQIKEIVTEAGSFTEASEKPKRAAPKRRRKPKAEPVAEETPATEAVAPEAATEAAAAEAVAPEAATEAAAAEAAAPEAATESKPKRARRTTAKKPAAKRTTAAKKPATRRPRKAAPKAEDRRAEDRRAEDRRAEARGNPTAGGD